MVCPYCEQACNEVNRNFRFLLYVSARQHARRRIGSNPNHRGLLRVASGLVLAVGLLNWSASYLQPASLLELVPRPLLQRARARDTGKKSRPDSSRLKLPKLRDGAGRGATCNVPGIVCGSARV
jgi:hypothetical protein